MFFRYLLFNAVVIFVVAYLGYFHSAFSWITQHDPTFIGVLIPLGYLSIVGYLFPLAMGRRKVNIQRDLRITDWLGKSLMGLGLIGTVIGMMIIFATVGTVTDIKSAIPMIMQGIGTAQITTLLGLGCSLLVGFHNLFVFGDTGDEG